MIMVSENDLGEIGTAEAAQRLSCSQRHVTRLVSEGKLKGRRYGPRRIRIPEQALIDYIAHYEESE